MSTPQDQETKLVQVSAESAFDRFDQWARQEKARATADNYRTAARKFVDWVKQSDYTLGQVDGWALGQYEDYLRKQDLADVTRKQYLVDTRQFLKFAGRREVMVEDLAEKLVLPTLTRDDRKADSDIRPDRVRKILQHLDKYRYASREHAMLTVYWQGLRIGAARSVDLENAKLDRENPRIEVEHRPGQDLPLKNGYKRAFEAERPIALTERDAQVLRDYIATNRHDVRDEHDFRPLITSENGRASKSLWRKTAYQITCPAYIGDTCEVHDHRPSRRKAIKCREVDGIGCVRPHDVRGAAITYLANKQVPYQVISERCNVSPKVISEHYDEPSTDERADRQSEAVDAL